jgi:hypothetical protein
MNDRTKKKISLVPMQNGVYPSVWLLRCGRLPGVRLFIYRLGSCIAFCLVVRISYLVVRISVFRTITRVCLLASERVLEMSAQINF